MRPKVLWIEDSARLELRHLVAPIYYSGKYEFQLAEDVTTAVRLLQTQSYDVVIVDIRLPPGMDGAWRSHYQRANQDKVQAQLGLRLLHWLLNGDANVHGAAPPPWIEPRRVAVFTVESKQEIQSELDRLGITIFQQKVAGLPDTVLLQLIERMVVAQVA